MPVLQTTAYSTVETVVLRARAILNDMEIVGGDVLTDAAPFTMQFAQIAYEAVQRRLALVGVEVSAAYAWLIGLPSMPILDPGGRLIVSDAGTAIQYPNGLNSSSQQNPQLPVDLIVPLKLWERQNNTTNQPSPMRESNDGLKPFNQQNVLIQWEWVSDSLQFIGSLQVEDVLVKYEKQLAAIASVNDPVPIRGVGNAAAYALAAAFAASRGSAMAQGFGAQGDDEIYQLQQASVHRRQRKHSRRKPYSGHGSRQGSVL